MSIIREHGGFVPVCDICFDNLPAQATFQDAVDLQKDEGWDSVLIAGEWHTKCADCIREGI